MSSSNAPSISQLPQRELTSAEQSRISELRQELQSLAATVSDVATKRISDVEEAAAKGVSFVRSEIQERPWMSLAIATAAGGLLAVAVLPARHKGYRYESMDPRHLAKQIRRAVSQIDTQPISSRFDRMMESVSSIDPSAITSSPAYDVVKNLVQSVSNSITKK